MTEVVEPLGERITHLKIRGTDMSIQYFALVVLAVVVGNFVYDAVTRLF